MFFLFESSVNSKMPTERLSREMGTPEWNRRQIVYFLYVIKPALASCFSVFSFWALGGSGISLKYQNSYKLVYQCKMTIKNWSQLLIKICISDGAVVRSLASPMLPDSLICGLSLLLALAFLRRFSTGFSGELSDKDVITVASIFLEHTFVRRKSCKNMQGRLCCFLSVSHLYLPNRVTRIGSRTMVQRHCYQASTWQTSSSCSSALVR